MAVYQQRPKYIIAFQFTYDEQNVAEKQEVSDHIFHFNPDAQEGFQYYVECPGRRFIVRPGDYAVVNPEGGYIAISKEEFERQFQECPV